MTTDLLNSLKADGTRFLRVLWCDNANAIRGKAIHLGALAHTLEHGVGISPAQQGVPIMYDAVAPGSGLGPVGEIRLVPDLATLTRLPYAPGHMRAMGDMVSGGKPWALCPRGFLKRIVAEAGREGIEIRAAFENEFYLLRETPEGLRPADDTAFASTLAMDLSREVIDGVTQSLLAQGLAVEQYYPESGPGQHEISVRHGDPLRAADGQVAYRETVHAVAAGHGLKASFLPKIFADKAGSGCHLHLSLWRAGRNLVPGSGGPEGLSDTARCFIAGILHHLPALMAVTTPTPNSYRRIRPHHWSGAFRCWGVDNREAAVRVISNPAGPGATNFELKTSDASANPYLALGTVIAAGLDGVRRNLDAGEPVGVDPGHVPEEERSARGIDLLPTTLGDSVERLGSDDYLLDTLGRELSEAFLAVRKAELEALGGLDLDDEVRLLLERY
jgi:glutamine synthetase